MATVGSSAMGHAPRMQQTTELPPDYAGPRDGRGVPDKPTVDGLEDRWAPGGQDEGTYLFDRTKRCRTRDADLLDRHPAADRQRHAARRPRLLLHPHRHRRPLPADARPRGLLPDGLGRQRAADRAPGAELLRRPVRPVAALRPDFTPPGEARPRTSMPVSPAQLRRAVRAADRGGRGAPSSSCGAGSACRWTGPKSTDHHRRPRAPPPSGRSCATWPAARPTGPEAPEPVGRHLPDRGRPGRAGGPRAPGRLPPDRLPPAATAPAAHRDHPARAGPGLRGAGGPPRRRALPAAVRHDGADAAVRRRGAGAGAPPRRARQGLGHRDDLHLRRPHRRHLVARAAAADCGRWSAGTAGCCADAGLAGDEPAPRRTPSWPARPSFGAQPRSSSCCATPATWTASRGRSPSR